MTNEWRWKVTDNIFGQREVDVRRNRTDTQIGMTTGSGLHLVRVPDDALDNLIKRLTAIRDQKRECVTCRNRIVDAVDHEHWSVESPYYVSVS